MHQEEGKKRNSKKQTKVTKDDILKVITVHLVWGGRRKS